MINQLPGTSGVDYGAWLATGNNPTMNPSTMAAAGFGSPVPGQLTGTSGIGYVNQPGQPQGMNTAQLSQAQQLMGGGVLPNPTLQAATQQMGGQMGGQMQTQMRQNQVQNRLGQGNWDQLNTNAQSKLGAALGGQSSAFSSPVPGQLTGTPVPGQLTGTPVPGQLTGTPVPGQLTGTTGYSQSDIQGRLSQGDWDQLNPDAQAKLTAAMLANPAAFGFPTSTPVPGQLTGTGDYPGGDYNAGIMTPGAQLTGGTQTPVPGQLTGSTQTGAQTSESGFTGGINTRPNYDIGGAPQTGLIGAENAINSGLNTGMDMVDKGVWQQAVTLSPYTSGGNSAMNYQAALSGALGNEAQAAAFQQYQESPGQAYLREMGEKAITRNSAATGGLGGGNVLQELQRHGMGLAAQDFNDNFNRLGSLSAMGFGASGQLGASQAQSGFMGGEMAYGAGNTIGAARSNAGNAIAGNVADTTSALSNLVNQQGSDAANIYGTQGGNLAQLLQGLGINDASTAQQLATILGNISIGQGSTAANLPAIGQFVNPYDASAGVSNVLTSLGGILTEV